MFLRFRCALRRLDDLAGGTTAFRVARLLVHMERKRGASGDRGELRVTRTEIARNVSARVETVVRTLAEWEKAGIILRRPRSIVVRDRPALNRLAGGVRSTTDWCRGCGICSEALAAPRALGGSRRRAPSLLDAPQAFDARAVQ
jgi:hypothetical protein